jgi:hypothetical protein
MQEGKNTHAFCPDIESRISALTLDTLTSFFREIFFLKALLAKAVE